MLSHKQPKNKMTTSSTANNIINNDLPISAIKIENNDTVKLSVQNCVNKNKPVQSMFSALRVAAMHDNYKCMMLLIKHGTCLDSSMDGSKETRLTPLHLAVQNNHLKYAELLLHYGARVSQKIEDVYHPIHLAVFNKNIKMVALLLDHGADVNLRFNNNFFEAFECNMHRSLWLDHDLTLLHYSILQKLKDMPDLLLNRGADVNLKTSLEKTTLMQAVEVNNVDLVKFLVEKRNANVNDCDIFGQSVLHFTMINANRKVSMYSKEEYALRLEKEDIVFFLLSNEADVNARFPADKDHSSVIHYMIKYGFSYGVYKLLEHKNFNLSDIDLESVYSGKLVSREITPDIANDFEYLSTLRTQFRLITEKIVKKAIIFQMLGYPVNKNLILKHPIHEELSVESYTRIMQAYRDKITMEIDYMEKTKINNYNITFWHLLKCTMNELVKLVSKKVVRNDNLFENYDFSQMYYSHSILSQRLFYAEQRKMLLEKSTEYVSNLLINILPYDCCERVVNYLNNQELNFN